MKDSSLVITLKVFANEELEQLSFLLKDPNFNVGSHANQNIELFNLLKKIIHTDDSAQLDKAIISQQLFGKDKAKQRLHYLENRMSELMAVVKKYIVWKEVNERWGSTFEEIAINRFYKRNALIKLQEKAISKAKSYASKDPLALIENPILKYWMDEAIFNLENLRNQRKGDLHIPETVHSLSTFYAIKLMELSLAEVQQDRVNPAFNPTWNVMIKDMRRLFRIYEFFNNPTLIMLEKALVLIEDQTEEPLAQLQTFIQFLQKYEQDLPSSISKNLAAYARNYCTLKINQGYRGFRDLRITIYKEHLEKGWLFEDGKLIPSTFINMVNIGLWSDEKEWVKYLLENFGTQLNGLDQEKILQYCFSLYHVYDRQFDKARSHLNLVFQSKKFADVSLERLVRILEIKILFEEKDDLIYTQLHNFLMFLRRSEKVFNKTARLIHIQFIKIIKRLLKIIESTGLNEMNSKKRLKELDKIEKELDTPLSPVVERLWLLEKLKEVKNE